MTGFVWTTVPILVVLASFATYVLIDENNQLDGTKAFVTINYLNILTMQHPTTMTMTITAKMIRIVFTIPPDSTHRSSTKS